MVLMWFEITNKYFGATSEVICQWFSRVTKSPVKMISKSHHEWAKNVNDGNEYIILFLTRYFMSWTHSSTKTIIDRSSRHSRKEGIFNLAL